ncbi:MAG TPA: aminoacyl-tRNA hydrolase [Bryobacteraceae bacterium]|nr:aminoacyl-tRNA hydrolase [Bryobacteraceae bacterium]
MAGEAQGAGEPQWLIAGLGNPGPDYEFTYHNLGFLAIDRLAEQAQARVVRPECKALVGPAVVAGVPVLLAKPQTFMNLSGGSVQPLLAKYALPPERLILIYDELALDWGSLRIRSKGSAGGHNGVSSVIRSVGVDSFIRVRLGFRPDFPMSNMKDYVLSRIRKAQIETLESTLAEARLAVETIITEGVEKAMTKHNRRAQGANEEQ